MTLESLKRPFNFWLNIYKPKAISSAKAVSMVKKVFRDRDCKVGHCGTLDVEAEGVLLVAVGEATKLVQILMEARKTYEFTVKFGAKTDTADSAGKIIAEADYIPSSEECHDVCKKFTGRIEQIPPAYSALKVNGMRSYKLARQNNPVELKPRVINIYDLQCLGFDSQTSEASYVAECSKGTYIRTLAEDIALSLQSLGFVIELRRTRLGIFKASDAIRIEAFEELDQELAQKFLENQSIRIEAVLDDIPVLEADDEQAKKIRYGQKCYFDRDQDINPVWVKYQGSLLAIGGLEDNCFNSNRVFNLIK